MYLVIVVVIVLLALGLVELVGAFLATLSLLTSFLFLLWVLGGWGIPAIWRLCRRKWSPLKRLLFSPTCLLPKRFGGSGW